jgi:hypothetical protein
MGRNRRTRIDIGFLCDVIDDVVSADAPMTVRQVFYQLVGRSGSSSAASGNGSPRRRVTG